MSKRKSKKYVSLMTISIIIVMALLAVCLKRYFIVPFLPSSAKVSSNGDLLIPFPYTDKKGNDIEQWELNRDTSNNLVITIVFNSNHFAEFPLKKGTLISISQSGKASEITDYKPSQNEYQIKLSGKAYTIIDIILNNDQTSGILTLRETH